MLGNSSTRYGNVAMLLHWLIAIAIVTLLIVGRYMHGLSNDDPSKFMLYQLHKSTGLTVLLLTMARIAWRLFNPPPALPATMAFWERWAAHSTHFAFYALMLAVPLSGWWVASTSSSGIPTVWFGLFEVPNLPAPQDLHDLKEMHEEAEETHELLGNLIILLLILHVGAALKHHFWDRDNVLKRMLPFTRTE
jgi:cytochrome b561